MFSSGTSDTRGAFGVDGWVSWGVDIGWTDARGACELGGHTELHTHELPGSPYSSGSRFTEYRKSKGSVKDGLGTKRKKKIFRDASESVRQ